MQTELTSKQTIRFMCKQTKAKQAHRQANQKTEWEGRHILCKYICSGLALAALIIFFIPHKKWEEIKTFCFDEFIADYLIKLLRVVLLGRISKELDKKQQAKKGPNRV